MFFLRGCQRTSSYYSTLFYNVYSYINLILLYYSHNDIAIGLLNDVLKQYQICTQLNLLHTFKERFVKNLNEAYTEHGEFVFNNNIKYVLLKSLFKIDEARYRNFNINELPWVLLLLNINCLNKIILFNKLYLVLQIWVLRRTSNGWCRRLFCKILYGPHQVQ